MINREVLWKRLTERYEELTPLSKAHFDRASKRQIRGGSHNLRLFAPYPFYDVLCSGKSVTDIDGNQYVDFWQGHYANILGHNPAVITEVLAREFRRGSGLHTGFPGAVQAELAEQVCRMTGQEKVRFTTSGALATLYGVMLGRGYTGRRIALKISGGWHGAQPYLLKGITRYLEGLGQQESEGLHPSCPDEIATTVFNDIDHLEDTFRRCGEQLACFILEPFIGEGGFLFLERKYLQRARQLCDEYGVVLIFDEIISGFRFHPGALSLLYGVTPDLAAFGKIVGGGMPVTALAGKAAIMDQCDPAAGSRRVRFEGGTFSAHPSAMMAGLAMLRYLSEHGPEIYPRINRLGARIRDEVPAVFEQAGIPCTCTGHPVEGVPGSSMAMIQFPVEAHKQISTPEENWNPLVCDFDMRERVLRLALITTGFHAVHGFGSICTPHEDQDIDDFLSAIEEIARLMKTPA
jgi:glutamate-1-semialdehyde 2,1-aminomutase